MSLVVAAEARVVELLEHENKSLERENGFLRDQVRVKDKQIADQQERARETNLLINGLQRLIAPLLSSPEKDRRAHSSDEFSLQDRE